MHPSQNSGDFRRRLDPSGRNGNGHARVVRPRFPFQQEAEEELRTARRLVMAAAERAGPSEFLRERGWSNGTSRESETFELIYAAYRVAHEKQVRDQKRREREQVPAPRPGHHEHYHGQYDNSGYHDRHHVQDKHPQKSSAQHDSRRKPSGVARSDTKLSKAHWMRDRYPLLPHIDSNLSKFGPPQHRESPRGNIKAAPVVPFLAEKTSLELYEEEKERRKVKEGRSTRPTREMKEIEATRDAEEEERYWAQEHQQYTEHNQNRSQREQEAREKRDQGKRAGVYVDQLVAQRKELENDWQKRRHTEGLPSHLSNPPPEPPQRFKERSPPELDLATPKTKIQERGFRQKVSESATKAKNMVKRAFSTPYGRKEATSPVRRLPSPPKYQSSSSSSQPGKSLAGFSGKHRENYSTSDDPDSWWRFTEAEPDFVDPVIARQMKKDYR